MLFRSPDLDIMYVGIGNGAPWNQRLRDPSGKDNLFLSSILALKPETGDYVWHYQTTPGETWDYTATQPLMLLGRLDPLHVRVDIDEHDGSRVAHGAAATGHVRGHPKERLTLEFVRMEPLVIPKRSLTGDAGERVDTRVLQAIYRIKPPHAGIFPGQQLDVFLEGRARP